MEVIIYGDKSRLQSQSQFHISLAWVYKSGEQINNNEKI
jgi:hypothetical protein